LTRCTSPPDQGSESDPKLLPCRTEAENTFGPRLPLKGEKERRATFREPHYHRPVWGGGPDVSRKGGVWQAATGVLWVGVAILKGKKTTREITDHTPNRNTRFWKKTMKWGVQRKKGVGGGKWQRNWTEGTLHSVTVSQPSCNC